MGIFIGQHFAGLKQIIQSYSLYSLIAFLILGFFFRWGESPAIGVNIGAFGRLVYDYLIAIVSIVAVMPIAYKICENRAYNIFTKSFTWLGQRTLGIYAIHGNIIVLSTSFLSQYVNSNVCAVLSFVITIALTIVLHVIFERGELAPQILLGQPRLKQN